MAAGRPGRGTRRARPVPGRGRRRPLPGGRRARPGPQPAAAGRRRGGLRRPPARPPAGLPLRARPGAGPGLPGLGGRRRRARARGHRRLPRPLPAGPVRGAAPVHRDRTRSAPRRPRGRRAPRWSHPGRRAAAPDQLTRGAAGRRRVGRGLPAHRRWPGPLPAPGRAGGRRPGRRAAHRAAPAGYDGAALRRAFRGRIALRRALSAVRAPGLVEAGFPLLATPPGRALGRAVLFGDRSFPDAVSGARAAGVPARSPAAPAPRRG